MRPFCNFWPALVCNHSCVAIISHLFHVWPKWSSTPVWHHIFRVDEQLVSCTLNFRIQYNIFCTDASILEEANLSQVSHPMSTVYSRIVSDWNQLPLRLCTISGTCCHELCTECNICALRSERVFVWGEIRSTDCSNIRVIKPAN